MEKYDVYSYLQQIMHLSFLQEYNKLIFINSCTLKGAYLFKYTTSTKIIRMSENNQKNVEESKINVSNNSKILMF